MNPRQKHVYRKNVGSAFTRLRAHPWYRYIMSLPFGVRIFASIVLSIVGIVGVFTPIPGGLIMILLALILIAGPQPVERNSLRLFFMLRSHKIIAKVQKLKRYLKSKHVQFFG